MATGSGTGSGISSSAARVRVRLLPPSLEALSSMLFSISTPNGHKARIPTLPVICRPEPEAVRERYARRLVSHPGSCYSPLLPYNLHALQEKERALVRLIRRVGLTPAETKRVLEIGCGTGDNLHKLIQLGFRPEN